MAFWAVTTTMLSSPSAADCWMVIVICLGGPLMVAVSVHVGALAGEMVVGRRPLEYLVRRGSGGVWAAR